MLKSPLVISSPDEQSLLLQYGHVLIKQLNGSYDEHERRLTGHVITLDVQPGLLHGMIPLVGRDDLLTADWQR